MKNVSNKKPKGTVSKEGKADAGKPDKPSREKELEGQLKKALADYQNLKRDMEKRLEFEGDLVKADLLRSVIEIADDIDLALDHTEDEKGWRDGVSQILEKFRATIEEMGAEVIACSKGDTFDPQIHEAVGVVYGDKDGKIAQVVQNGYIIGDKVVRPARVIVHKIKISTK